MFLLPYASDKILFKWRDTTLFHASKIEISNEIVIVYRLKVG